MSESQSSKIFAVCKICAKTFYVKPSHFLRRKCCSIRCAAIWKQVPKQRISYDIRFWKYIGTKQVNGCILWSGYCNQDGYGQMNIGGGKREGAHRIAYRLMVGPIPSGISVLHRCDNPPCINPTHLFLGTQLTNMADCAAKLRRPSILSKQQILEIRAKYSLGSISQKALADEYGTRQENIWHIVNRKTWNHL